MPSKFYVLSCIYGTFFFRCSKVYDVMRTPGPIDLEHVSEILRNRSEINGEGNSAHMVALS